MFDMSITDILRASTDCCFLFRGKLSFPLYSMQGNAIESLLNEAWLAYLPPNIC